MDTGEDFITPEFMNILFFQQKNLVIFPYVDLKHLHALEIFASGYNIVDLESTVLHDLKNILEFEVSNSYSQSPTMYFIYNLDKPKVQEIMTIESIHCVLNSNENISQLANGSDFIFYNKKNGKFLNYPENSTDLEFEKTLISSSSSTTILQDSIQGIKSTASKLFEQINQNKSLDKVAILLKDYDAHHWQKILDFTASYYDIQLPDVSELFKYSSDVSFSKKWEENLQDFSEEYELIVSKNKAIGKEFIQLIHEYRSAKVNPAHLELEELFSPLKLYNYLRNHHWKDGIPESFIKEWFEMKLSQYKLTEEDIVDFEDVCSRLGISQIGISSPPPDPIKLSSRPPLSDQIFISEKPSLRNNWQEYKQWLIMRTESFARLVDNSIENQLLTQNKKLYSYLAGELSNLLQLLRPVITPKSPQKSQMGEDIKKVIRSRLDHVKIKQWVELFSIKDKFRLVSIFRKYIERLYNDLFGRDPYNEKIVPKIKALTSYFHFPKKLESNLLWFNNFRNKLTHDDRYSDSEVDLMLSINLNRINNIVMGFIVALITHQLKSLLRNNRHLYDEIHTYIRNVYFSADYASALPLHILHEKILVV